MLCCSLSRVNSSAAHTLNSSAYLASPPPATSSPTERPPAATTIHVAPAPPSQRSAARASSARLRQHREWQLLCSQLTAFRSRTPSRRRMPLQRCQTVTLWTADSAVWASPRSASGAGSLWPCGRGRRHRPPRRKQPVCGSQSCATARTLPARAMAARFEPVLRLDPTISAAIQDARQCKRAAAQHRYNGKGLAEQRCVAFRPGGSAIFAMDLQSILLE